MSKKYITVYELIDSLNHYLDLCEIHGGLYKALNSELILEIYDEENKEIFKGKLSCCSIDRNGRYTLSADVEDVQILH